MLCPAYAKGASEGKPSYGKGFPALTGGPRHQSPERYRERWKDRPAEGPSGNVLPANRPADLQSADPSAWLQLLGQPFRFRFPGNLPVEHPGNDDPEQESHDDPDDPVVGSFGGDVEQEEIPEIAGRAAETAPPGDCVADPGDETDDQREEDSRLSIRRLRGVLPAGDSGRAGDPVNRFPSRRREP